MKDEELTRDQNNGVVSNQNRWRTIRAIDEHLVGRVRRSNAHKSFGKPIANTEDENEFFFSRRRGIIDRCNGERMRL